MKPPRCPVCQIEHWGPVHIWATVSEKSLKVVKPAKIDPPERPRSDDHKTVDTVASPSRTVNAVTHAPSRTPLTGAEREAKRRAKLGAAYRVKNRDRMAAKRAA